MLYNLEDLLEYNSNGALDTDSTSIRAKYSAMLYANENTVQQSLKKSFPTDLDEY